MTFYSPLRSLWSVAVLIVFIISEAAAAQEPPAPLAASEITKTAEEAYVYAYPLVTMEVARRVMTNAERVEGGRGPLGSFVHSRDRLGNGRRGPLNPDLLFSSAWLDLSGEPYVLTLPNVRPGYFLLSMIDGWTNVFALLPGREPKGEKILIAGPGWVGEVPEGMREVKCVTTFAWLIGQFGLGFVPDKQLHAWQDQLQLTPLSKYENAYLHILKPRPVDPAIDMATPIREQVNALSGPAYFKLFSDLLKTNEPILDSGLMLRLRRLGLVAGEDFDPALFLADPEEKLRPSVAAQGKEIHAALMEAPKRGQRAIREYFAKTCPRNNGWLYATQTGEYSNGSLQRAAMAYYGLGATRSSEFMTAETQRDSRGRPLEGQYRYRVHFESLPPVGAFWSLGVVNHQGNLVPNEAGQYAITSRKKGEGAFDLLVQRARPGGGAWLPAPEGRFALVLRLYKPLAPARDGSWRYPVVERIE